MHLRRGDGIEVKWTINDDDDDDDDARGEGGRDGDADAEAAAATVTVWWAATLDEKTERMHELTPEESRESGEAGDACPAAGVRVPVYALNYAALKGEAIYQILKTLEQLKRRAKNPFSFTGFVLWS